MACSHLHMIDIDAKPNTPGCEECLRNGTWWVRLRMCLTCGHVGCCDSSPNRHARKHWESTGHPILQSFEPGQDNMRWCFEDEEVV